MARVMPPTIRSGPSRKACYLRFINQTTRKVNVIWVDYVGGTRNYGTLDPYKHFDIHTYEGHPWICEDSASKKRMLLNKMLIFYPSTSSDHPATNEEFRCYIPVLSNNELIRNGLKREYVHITLPVFPLLERSAEVIITNLSEKGDIKCLDLPNRMKDMLSDQYFQH